MNPGHVAALFRKELRDLSRNLGVLFPVALVAVLTLALPFVLTIVVPAVSGHALSEDSDLLRASGRIAAHPWLSAEGRVQLFFFEQFVLLFLLLPITGSMALAAHSIVGEKQGRTLEPLLATPITTFELLTAKVLGALTPALGISLLGLAGYLAGIVWLGEPGVLRALLNGRTAALVFVVGPAAALASLQVALIVSSRVNDSRTAQQFGVLIILPLSAVLVAQFTGSLWLSASSLVSIGVGLLVVWLILMLVSVAVFNRETILTRWR
jgi:ABC-2 type transport system permease protein